VSRNQSNPCAAVSRIERVLRLLAQMPAPEPPEDLLQRTLQRVERASPSHSAVASKSADVPSPEVH
jgi:hypothetical protein